MEDSMNRRNLLRVLLSAFMFSVARRSSSEEPLWRSTASDQTDIPAFHSRAPDGPLPTTLRPELFSDPVAKVAYTLAAKVRPVLYQQPCYCYCDRSLGHQSLLDCYTGRHASECSACQKQEIYAYGETLAGKSAAEIRRGMIRQEWKNVDLRVAVTATHF